MRKVSFPSSIPLVIVEFNYIVYKINFNNFTVMDVAVTCKYDWKCRFFTVRWLFTENIFSCSFLFQLQINKNNRNINSHKKIKLNLFRIINFKSVGTSQVKI